MTPPGEPTVISEDITYQKIRINLSKFFLGQKRLSHVEIFNELTKLLKVYKSKTTEQFACCASLDIVRAIRIPFIFNEPTSFLN